MRWRDGQWTAAIGNDEAISRSLAAPRCRPTRVRWEGTGVRGGRRLRWGKCVLGNREAFPSGAPVASQATAPALVLRLCCTVAPCHRFHPGPCLGNWLCVSSCSCASFHSVEHLFQPSPPLFPTSYPPHHVRYPSSEASDIPRFNFDLLISWVSTFPSRPTFARSIPSFAAALPVEKTLSEPLLLTTSIDSSFRETPGRQ